MASLPSNAPNGGSIVRTILRRRSYRNFRPDPLPVATLEALRGVLERSPSVAGRRSGYALLVDDADRVSKLPGAVTSGLVGKINLWLPRTPPAAFLIVAGDSKDGIRDEDRHYYNVDGAVAGQLAVLEAAAHGVATCWMGGFHERSVAEVVGLPEGHRPLAVIPLGLPSGTSGGGGSLLTRGWDAAAQRIISGRRKPLDEVAFRGRLGSLFVAESPTANPGRGVEGGDGEAWPGLGPLRPAPSFTGAPVTAGALTTILECARWAPSAENSQIARHVVLEGPDAVGPLLEAAFPGRPGAVPAAIPPLVIVSLGAPFIVKARTREQPFYLIDVPIAVTNMLAACEDLALGWQVGVRFDHKAVAAHLGAPDGCKAVAMTAIGRAGPADALPADLPRGPLDQLR